MASKKEWLAMLLAGGQGSRLYTLTKTIAKPAVSYGGKYRIIDFPLSNCVNSGIDTVGVLTQYQPLLLNEYISNGIPWDLDRMNGGVHILPPYQTSSGSTWYRGTANAIYQNIPFIKQYDPEYVVILSGDHIYKMNYGKMLAFHKEKDADCTIAVLEVPIHEASRFGIMNADDDMRIHEFEEKPEEPKSNLASMGVYIFTWSKLKKYLEDDAKDEYSSNDFGKNIIPNMLENNERLYAYPFNGYWKDVGTIDSLWEANMDLLDPNAGLELDDESWRIYSRNPGLPPHYASDTATIQNSLVTEGCDISGEVDFSVLFAGVVVEEGAVVHDSIIMPNTTIKKGAVIEYSIISEEAVIEENAIIGGRPEDNPDNWGITVVGKGITVGKNAKIAPKQLVENDVPEQKNIEIVSDDICEESNKEVTENEK